MHVSSSLFIIILMSGNSINSTHSNNFISDTFSICNHFGKGLYNQPNLPYSNTKGKTFVVNIKNLISTKQAFVKNPSGSVTHRHTKSYAPCFIFLNHCIGQTESVFTQADRPGQFISKDAIIFSPVANHICCP